ncbi:MAG TPA: hypothetical protein PK397_06655 [Ignavibacteriaceae bacterium]|nr:hypothetical protein [Ignavibacteriaceae bacterium]
MLKKTIVAVFIFITLLGCRLLTHAKSPAEEEANCPYCFINFGDLNNYSRKAHKLNQPGETTGISFLKNNKSKKL